MFERKTPAMETGLEEEMRRLQASINEAQRRLHQVETEAQQGDQRAASTSDVVALSAISASRVRLKHQALELKDQIDGAQHRLVQLRQEHNQRRMHLTFLQERKLGLVRALGEATSDREREVVEHELLQVLRRLARLTGDENARRESQQFERRLEDAAPYITLRRGYAWTADRRLVAEDDEAACITAYGRGVRVDRSEAQRIGLLALEGHLQ